MFRQIFFKLDLSHFVCLIATVCILLSGGLILGQISFIEAAAMNQKHLNTYFISALMLPYGVYQVKEKMFC